MKLIVPVAGQSSRFQNLRPKWLLIHPNGNLMLTEALSGISMEGIEEIVIVSLQEIEERFPFQHVLLNQFRKIGISKPLKIILLNKPTQSQPETIAQALKILNADFPFFIKDCDNFFKCTPHGKNSICIYDLNESSLINPQNKSYVQINEKKYLTKIVEKKVISHLFSCGGYEFSSSHQYLKYFEKFSHDSSLYLSHIVYSMVLDNISFKVNNVELYDDWGTIEDWNRYKSKFATLFVDIDGTLVKNSGEFFSPLWGETVKILENVQKINELYHSGKVRIILTTSRPEEFKSITLNQLDREGVCYHQIIFGLFHSKRILINDYSLTNPYKSCDAINLKRDMPELSHMLEDTLK